MTSPEQYETWAKEAVYERDDAIKRAEGLVEALEEIARGMPDAFGWRKHDREHLRAIARKALTHYKEQG